MNRIFPLRFGLMISYRIRNLNNMVKILNVAEYVNNIINYS